MYVNASDTKHQNVPHWISITLIHEKTQRMVIGKTIVFNKTFFNIKDLTLISYECIVKEK